VEWVRLRIGWRRVKLVVLRKLRTKDVGRRTGLVKVRRNDLSTERVEDRVERVCTLFAQCVPFLRVQLVSKRAEERRGREFQ
jgi:hypothetical protein